MPTRPGALGTPFIVSTAALAALASANFTMLQKREEKHRHTVSKKAQIKV